jgi:hypothetical protein
MRGGNDGPQQQRADPASLRVAILSDSWPPDRCGIADYSTKLTARLEQLDVTVADPGRCSSPDHLFAQRDA